MDDNSVISEYKLNEDKEPFVQSGDRPSFWSYILASRTVDVCKDRKTGKCYNVVRSKPQKVIGLLRMFFILMTLHFAVYISILNGGEYPYDILIAAGIVILILLGILEYKLVKFQEFDESELKNEDRRILRRSRYSFIALYIIGLLVIILAFLNSFSFGWLRSLNEDNKEAYLNEISVNGEWVELDRDASRVEIDGETTLREIDSVRLRFITERSLQDIEISFNGNKIEEEAIFSYRTDSYLWDGTYFVSIHSISIDKDEFEEYNVLNITCDEVSNDYELVIVDYSEED